MDTIYKNEFEHHSVKAIIVALNRWFANEGKLPVKYFDTFIGYSDFCIDEPYVDNGVHLDGRHSHYYNGSTWDSNAECPTRPKDAAYAAIEYLREEYGIFYSPQMEPDNDHKTKGELKEKVRADYWFRTARERLEEIEKLRKEIKGQTKDNTDYILNAFREILDALGIDRSEYVHMDIPSLTHFAIMEAEKAASNLDNYRGGAIKFAADYSALQKEKEDLEKRIKTLIDSNNLLGKDYLEANAARNRLEKELKREKDWNLDLEERIIASKENLADILETLGISRSISIGKSTEFLQRHAVQRASLIKAEHDKFLEIIDASEAIDDARTERLNNLVTKVSKMYQKLIGLNPNETCACAAEPQLEVIETYISELKITNEALRKDASKWLSKCNDLRIRCNSVFGAGGFVTKAMINDLCDEYNIVRPGDDEDCKDSLRYILNILKEYRDETLRETATKKNLETLRKQVRKTYDSICGPDPAYRQIPTCARCLEEIEKQAHVWKEKIHDMSRAAACLNTCIKDLYKFIFNSAPQNMDDEEMLERIKKAYENSLNTGVNALRFYNLLCEYCDKYEIKKPSSDLTLEECIDDILKRFKITLKENQDFRYAVEKLYVNMTDQQPKYMTVLGILNAIAEDVDDREAEYSYMEEKYSIAEKLRKDWVRRYESEHERANGEHKKADKYWAQVAGLQTRIKNLEDALDKAASNSVGYEALKNTLRKTLDSESRLKFERDSLAEELKKAKDAIRKQNEAILRNERLDEPDDTSGQ